MLSQYKMVVRAVLMQIFNLTTSTVHNFYVNGGTDMNKISTIIIIITTVKKT